MRFLIAFLLLFSNVQGKGQVPVQILSSERLLLDNPAIANGCQMAFSFHKIRTNFTGNCLAVRRLSDNATQNFGFINNYVDTNGIKAFVGSSSGVVPSFFNQITGGIHLLENAGTGPTIVNNGIPVRENGLWALSFNGTTQHLRLEGLDNITFFSNIGYAGGVFVTRSNTLGSARRILHAGMTTSPFATRFLASYVGTNTIGVAGVRLNSESLVNVSGGTNLNTQNVTSHILDYANSDSYVFQNGSQVAFRNDIPTQGNTQVQNLRVWVGQNIFGGEYFSGTMQEILLWNVNIQNQLPRIHSNIIRRYKIP